MDIAIGAACWGWARRIARSICYLAAGAIATTCLGATVVNTLDEDILRYPGFQTYPTPRTFDGPGTVFRLTADRQRFSVTVLHVHVEKIGAEEFSDYSSDVKWSASALARFLGKIHLLSAPEVGAEGGHQMQIRLKIGTGYRERTYDDDVEKAVRDARIKFRRDSRYFVVRETIAVQDLSISANPRSSAGAEASATLNRIATAEASVRWADESHKSLIRTFSPPHYIFYQVDEIFPPGPAMNADASPILVRLSDETLQWTSETDDADELPAGRTVTK